MEEPTSPLTATMERNEKQQKKKKQRTRVMLMTANYIFLFMGSISSTLLTRFYFVHGGSSRWLSTLVQSLGFPLLLPFLFPHCRKPATILTRKLTVLSLVVGLFLGLNNFLISWGLSFLPVSTSSLLLSTQLAFTFLLSFLLVCHPLSLTNLNCVVLLSLSSVLIAIKSSHDLPHGVTHSQFLLGLAAALAAALLFASYLPVLQIILREVPTYRGVVEVQILMEIAATAFALAGMVAGRGFDEVRKDALAFGYGVRAYWAVVAATVVCWQMCFMATAGSVFLTSSLNSGICMTALLSANVIAGVVVFGDSFSGIKAVAMTMCVWGFATYLYGEHGRKRKEEVEKIECHGGEREEGEV